MDTTPESPSTADGRSDVSPAGSGLARRRLITGGAVAGMSVLVLPTAARAASGDATPSEPVASDSAASEGSSVVGENETVTAPSPTPQPPVESATTTLDSVTIGTDGSSNAGVLYEYSTDNVVWTSMGVGSLSNNYVVSGLTGNSHTVYVRKGGSGGTTSRINLTRETKTVTTASGTATFSVPASASGVRQVTITAVGGRGGRGGNDTFFGSTTYGADPGNPGLVTVTYNIDAGTSFVMRAGAGGSQGQDKSSGGGGPGGTGGANGLSRSGASDTYQGGNGGSAGGSFYSGGGGGGGAASVVQLTASSGTPIVVAAGSGGGGGGEHGETPSSAAPGQNYSASNLNTGSTAGKTAANGGGGVDCGGNGGGGGGYVGGSSRQSSASGQSYGDGGYRGQNYLAAAVTGLARTGAASDANATGRSVSSGGFVSVTYLTPDIILGV